MTQTKKKTAASKSKKGTKGKENKAKSKGRGRAKAAPKASKAAAPEPLTAKAATKIVNDLIAKETKALKSICNKKVRERAERAGERIWNMEYGRSF